MPEELKKTKTAARLFTSSEDFFNPTCEVIMQVKTDEDAAVDTTDFVDDVRRGRWSDIIRTLVPILVGGLLIYGSVPAALFFDEPSLAALGLWMGWIMVAGGALAHIVRRIMFPYIDMRNVAAEGVKSPVGAGLVFLGMCFVIGCLVLASGSAKASSDIPPGAQKYIPVLKSEVSRLWGDFERPQIFAGQVEHESCVSLKHSKCFTPYAALITSRETGRGLGMITKTARFDALAEMVAAHPKELAGWAWDKPSIYDPVFQLRALVLKNKDNWRRITGMANEREHVATMLIAYNGGYGRVVSDRQLCRATPGCDARYWYGHAEKTSRLAKTAVSGYGKSFFDINRHYPVDIEKRALKYVKMMS